MKIIATSHGKLCDGLIDSYKMIVGEAAEIITLPFLGSLTDFRKQQKEIFETYKGEKLLVLCDLLGGTPYNEFLRAKIEGQFVGEIICGFNLGMLIELSLALTADEPRLDDMIDLALHAGKSSIRLAECEEGSCDEIDF